MSDVTGISGTLFPSRYLADRLADDLDPSEDAGPTPEVAAKLARWWRNVAATCGPATGLRALFDLVAMPLLAVLGFRARSAAFGDRSARATLDCGVDRHVALVLVPWAARPSQRWREVHEAAREAGGDWSILLAPPFLSIVDARARAARRSLDFAFPAVLTGRGTTVLWTLGSAVAFRPDETGSTRIDRLLASAARFQDRVRTDLEVGVRNALESLATALDRLPRAGHSAATVPAADEALTIVYRILFLLFAEARHLAPASHPVYSGAYAVATLCREAVRNETEPGLWEGLAAVTRLARYGCRTTDLEAHPFNGRLFSRAAAPSLERRLVHGRRSAAIEDDAMRAALVALGSRQGPRGREEITYADLGVEELGTVYERVLDLDLPAGRTRPSIGRPDSRTRHSRRRKQSGTFYTPRALAEFVVRRTLAPLVDGVSADDILRLRVVDPAMGSGAFLVAACQYLADAYDQALIEEGRASATDFNEHTRADSRRLIAEHCLAGVDRNPTAVHLAQLSLWLTTLARTKPLGFLDHRLRVGDSLVGAAPEDITRRSFSRPSRENARSLFDDEAVAHTLARIVRPLRDLSGRRDDTADDVRAKERLWKGLTTGESPLGQWRLALSLWCAHWFWPPEDGARPLAHEARAAIDALVRGDTTLPRTALAKWVDTARRVERLRAFFHWPLEFADVFYDEHGLPRSKPGFDAVIGNPPWEMLRDDDGESTQEARGMLRFIREAGQFPSCQRGHVNLYQPFVDRALALTRAGGRVGLLLPWGLASDDGATSLRARLFGDGGLETVVGFDNARGLFPIHRGTRFLALVARPGRGAGDVRSRFGVRSVAEIETLPAREDRAETSEAYPTRFSGERLRRISGPALRIPDARGREDLELAARLTDAFPPLGDPSGWHATFGRDLNATEDRKSFGPAGLPVLEGKHLSPWRVDRARATSFITRADAVRLLPDRRFERSRLAYRDVSGVGNQVSLIAAVLPSDVVTTHTLYCLRGPIDDARLHFLCALFNSYVLNWFVRLFMGSHVNTSLVEILPVPHWQGTRNERGVARLSQTIASGARSGWRMASIQARVARLYGLEARTFARILNTFPLVPSSERDHALRALTRCAAVGATAPSVG